MQAILRWKFLSGKEFSARLRRKNDTKKATSVAFSYQIAIAWT
jgi:hypothetical protein